MTAEADESVDEGDEALVQRLRDATPAAPPRLHRSVRERVSRAVARRALRPRAALFLTSGALLLAVALVVAVSGPL
jgi:hypothetical protein